VPGMRRGSGLRHASQPLPGPLAAIPSPVRKAWRTQCYPLRARARQRPGVRVFALGQRWRHCAAHGTAPAGAAQGARGRWGWQAKQAGW